MKIQMCPGRFNICFFILFLSLSYAFLYKKGFLPKRNPSFFPFSTEEGEHDEHGGEQGGNQAHHGNLGVDGGAGGVLEGVAHGVANDGRLVGVAALAALGAGLNVLLGVVPQAAGIGHEQSQQQAADDIAQQEAANGAGAADEAYDDGGASSTRSRTAASTATSARAAL